MPIPRYFVREKMRALKEREKMLAHVLTSGGHQEHKTVSESEDCVKRIKQNLVTLYLKHKCIMHYKSSFFVFIMPYNAPYNAL